jgi:hypothetical protein
VQSDSIGTRNGDHENVERHPAILRAVEAVANEGSADDFMIGTNAFTAYLAPDNREIEEHAQGK